MAGVVLGLYDKQTVASVALGGSLVALVSVFIYGSQGKSYQQSQPDNTSDSSNEK